MSNVICAMKSSRKKQHMSKCELETDMLEMINDGLSSFNNLETEAIYLNLEKNFKIQKEEIPNKIEEFADAIEHILGTGAKIVEIAIIERIHQRIPKFVFIPKGPDLNFKEYLLSLNSYLLSSVP